MTEAEWLSATDPAPMLEWLRGRASDRKLRLFAVACCRRIWHLLILRRHEPSRRVVELVEAVVDGKVSELRLPSAYEAARTANGPFIVPHTHACTLTACLIRENVGSIASYSAAAMGNVTSEQVEQSRLLREIFGNPFRPVTLDPAWLTSTAVALARGIYDEKAFDRMPILADALQDAGCEDEAILTHCRDEKGVHVRGCWVVDLVLGKA